MITHLSLAVLKDAELVGRDTFKVGDHTYRVTGWDSGARSLQVVPVR